MCLIILLSHLLETVLKLLMMMTNALDESILVAQTPAFGVVFRLVHVRYRSTGGSSRRTQRATFLVFGWTV